MRLTILNHDITLTLKIERTPEYTYHAFLNPSAPDEMKRAWVYNLDTTEAGAIEALTVAANNHWGGRWRWNTKPGDQIVLKSSGAGDYTAGAIECRIK